MQPLIFLGRSDILKWFGHVWTWCDVFLRNYQAVVCLWRVQPQTQWDISFIYILWIVPYHREYLLHKRLQAESPHVVYCSNITIRALDYCYNHYVWVKLALAVMWKTKEHRYSIVAYPQCYQLFLILPNIVSMYAQMHMQKASYSSWKDHLTQSAEFYWISAQCCLNT